MVNDLVLGTRPEWSSISLTNPSVVGIPVITPTCSVVSDDSSVFTCNILSKGTLLSFSMSHASLVGPSATATLCVLYMLLKGVFLLLA